MSIADKIECALAAWKEDHNGTLPDVLYLGYDDVLALDKLAQCVVLRYLDMAIVCTDKRYHIGLGRMYA